jgi:hypothetical protein
MKQFKPTQLKKIKLGWEGPGMQQIHAYIGFKL